MCGIAGLLNLDRDAPADAALVRRMTNRLVRVPLLEAAGPVLTAPMNDLGLAFCVLASLLQIALPRRWAPLPLLLSVLYMTRAQAWEVAGAHLTVLHLVVAAGLLRVWIRGEGLADGLRGVDRAMLLWAALLLGTSAFHAYDGWLFRSGLLWIELGQLLPAAHLPAATSRTCAVCSRRWHWPCCRWRC